MMVKQRKNRRMLVNEVDKEAEVTAPNTNEITRIDDQIADLREQIASIHRSLANTTANSSRSEPHLDSSNVNRPVAESSPILLPETQQGTRNCPSSVVEGRSPNDRFWLFFDTDKELRE